MGQAGDFGSAHQLVGQDEMGHADVVTQLELRQWSPPTGPSNRG